MQSFVYTDLNLSEPMTLIAATSQPDYILIGSDSQLTEASEGLRSTTDLRSTMEKLHRHDTAPLVWGTSGNPALGVDQFTDWLKSYNWPPKSKRELRDALARQVAEINGKQREHCALAGVEATDEELFSVLAVAWLDEQPLVIAVDNRGVISSIDSVSFHAIGSGRIFAKVINETISSLSNQPFSDQTAQFRFTLRLASNMAPNCKGPFILWKVNRKGEVTNLSGE